MSSLLKRAAERKRRSPPLSARHRQPPPPPSDPDPPVHGSVLAGVPRAAVALLGRCRTGRMGAARPAWRSSLLALCLLPVALPLLLISLPLLCVAVAAARFRRRRRKLMMTPGAAGEGRSSCRVAPGGWPAPEPEGDGNRAELLHKYLQDQMELVGAVGRRPSSQQSQLQQ